MHASSVPKHRMHHLQHPSAHGHGPWKRVLVDFASSGGKHHFILVDLYSLWPEVAGSMRSTDGAANIIVLFNLFTRYGFPEQAVSDNGPPFNQKNMGTS